MKLNKRYIKAFSKSKSEELQEVGYKFLYEANGVFYFEDNQNLTANFTHNNENYNLLKGTKYSSYIPL